MAFSPTIRIALWVKVGGAFLLLCAFIYHQINGLTLRRAQNDFLVASVKDDLPGMERALNIQYRELCASWFLTNAEKVHMPCEKVKDFQ